MLLFLWIVFLLANIVAQNTETQICDEIYQKTQDVWLIGEAPETSFASQYLAILAYIPTAIVLKSYLVVSDLAVHEAVRENGAIISWKKSSSAFSSFFDLERFASYWAKHRMKVISSSTYQNCFSTDAVFGRISLAQTPRFSHHVAELFRIPEFLPYTRQSFNIMIDYANFSTGRKLPHFPFPPHHQVRIKSRYKMAAMYSFWNDTTPLLSYVLTSIKPAKPIQAAVDSLISLLPHSYLAVHVRLDDTAFNLIDPPDRWTGNNTENREEHVISLIVASIVGSSCVSQHGAKSLYLVTNYSPSHPVTKKRTARLVEALKQASFPVVTRKSLASHGLKGKEQKKIENLPNLRAMRDMTPEHWNYIDMLVSEQSSCFIPSLAPSLMSYMITRYQKLTKKIFEKYDEINRDTYGAMYFYRDWGF